MNSIRECRKFNKLNRINKRIICTNKKKLKREKTIPKHIDDCWSIDLIDVNNVLKYNKGFKFILTDFDIFSKNSWAIPLKNKSSISV